MFFCCYFRLNVRVILLPIAPEAVWLGWFVTSFHLNVEISRHIGEFV